MPRIAATTVTALPVTLLMIVPTGLIDQESGVAAMGAMWLALLGCSFALARFWSVRLRPGTDDLIVVGFRGNDLARPPISPTRVVEIDWRP